MGTCCILHSERVGFEPTVPFKGAQLLSREPDSASLAPLQGVADFSLTQDSALVNDYPYAVGERGIRTPGPRRGQRFSRPPLSTAQPSLLNEPFLPDELPFLDGRSRRDEQSPCRTPLRRYTDFRHPSKKRKTAKKDRAVNPERSWQPPRANRLRGRLRPSHRLRSCP